MELKRIDHLPMQLCYNSVYSTGEFHVVPLQKCKSDAPKPLYPPVKIITETGNWDFARMAYGAWIGRTSSYDEDGDDGFCETVAWLIGQRPQSSNEWYMAKHWKDIKWVSQGSLELNWPYDFVVLRSGFTEKISLAELENEPNGPYSDQTICSIGNSKTGPVGIMSRLHEILVDGYEALPVTAEVYAGMFEGKTICIRICKKDDS